MKLATGERLARIGLILTKELFDIWQRQGLKTTLLVPVALLTLMAVLALYAAGLTSPAGPLPALPAEMAGSSPREIAQYMALSPFLMLWLIFPVSVPTALAAYSIVGEKEEGTLEPLLATPVGTGELLIAKALAAGLPGLVLLWVPYFATLLTGWLLDCPRVMASTLLSPAWLLTMVLVAPALTFLTVMILVIVSARAQDVRSANQAGSLLILPLVLLFVSQVSSGLSLAVPVVLAAWLLLVLLGFGVMILALRVFQRESILVRWKASR